MAFIRWGQRRDAWPAATAELAAWRSLKPQNQDLAGWRILVTAGPTRERLDPVRYMSNDSSGKMGYAIAQAAAQRGAQVTLVTGPVALTPPPNIQVERVESARELFETVTRLAPDQDAVIQAAAPADYRFAQTSQQKLKKQGGEGLTLTLVENPDVAAAVGAAKRPGQLLVGFAAETQELIANAQKKLEKKRWDLIVANDVTQPGAGFNVDTNIAALITRQGVCQRPLESKRSLAEEILNQLVRLRRDG